MTHRERYIRNIEDTFASGLLTVTGKVADYAQEADSFSNFRFAAQAAGITVEQVFLVLLGVKLARLGNLVVGNTTPNNESVVDTLIDQMNYSAIMTTYLELKNTTDPSYAYAGEPEDGDDANDPTEEQIAELYTNPSPTTRMLNFFGLTPK